MRTLISTGAVMSILAAEISVSAAPIAIKPAPGARKHKVASKPAEIDLATCSRQVRRQLEREAAKAKKR